MYRNDVRLTRCANARIISMASVQAQAALSLIGDTAQSDIVDTEKEVVVWFEILSAA